MTLMTITEAAEFLRLTKRTLYQRTDIPRVRYGHRVMFVKEDLGKWIRSLRDGQGLERLERPVGKSSAVDAAASKVYHRNPIFVTRT